MSVSIVQLTYNNRTQVARCLPTVAVMALRDEVKEWIVLDNASRDGTLDELERMRGICGKLRIIRATTNLGCCGGRNEAWREAKSEFLLSLDSDVYCEQLAVLPRMMADLKSRRAAVVGEHGGWVRRDWSWTESAPDRYVGAVPIVSGFCQLFRRELVDRWKPFNLTRPYWLEDSDFCLQAGGRGWIDRYGMRHTWSRTNGRDEAARLEAWEEFRGRWQGAGMRVTR